MRSAAQCQAKFVHSVTLNSSLTLPVIGRVQACSRGINLESVMLFQRPAIDKRNLLYLLFLTHAAPASRRPQDRVAARRRCSASAREERARRGVPRRPGILRSARPCAGEVRDASAPPRRGSTCQLVWLLPSASAAAQAFYLADRAFEDRPPGLVPRPRGPKRNHKCTDEVLDFAEQWQTREGAKEEVSLVEAVRSRFGLTINPRSLDRALARRKKKLQAKGRTPV